MYRHSYDPNPRLAQGMGHILALAYPTQGSTSIVDENLDGIFEVNSINDYINQLLYLVKN